MLFKSVFLIHLALVTSPTQANDFSPLDPTTNWANTFLLNTLFVAEYLSHMNYSKLQKYSQDKSLGSLEAKNLLVRSKFALLSSQNKNQVIKSSTKAISLSAVHATYLKDQQSSNHLAFDVLGKTAIDANFYNYVGATFTEKKFHESWQYFEKSYASNAPVCNYQKDIKLVLSQYQGLLAKNQAAAHSSQILQPIKNWSLPKVRCFIITLMAPVANHLVPKDHNIFDPIHILNALDQINSPFAKDMTIKALHATRFFQLNHFAESLRVLVSMQDNERSYRLPYEMVQRIYSRSEKGEGKVALKGL